MVEKKELEIGVRLGEDRVNAFREKLLIVVIGDKHRYQTV
jgi:hypothetical protein